MAGHSILYLGRGEFATDYLSELETLPCCTLLTRSAKFEVPDDAPSIIDVVLVEAGPAIVQSGLSLAELISLLAPYPVVALTTREREYRGIAAVRAGAQGYICVDDITVEAQDAVLEHAVQRHRLQTRLSETDVSVLTILRNINVLLHRRRRRKLSQFGRLTSDARSQRREVRQPGRHLPYAGAARHDPVAEWPRPLRR